MDFHPIDGKKGSKRPMLTQQEKLDIVHSVIVKFMLVKDVAKYFRVSYATVTMLVSKSKKNPRFIDELFAK